jgi:predicted phosphodiesterase
VTKLAVLADIHGNLPALEAVISDLKNFDVDHVIVPGDVIGFGPFSRQTAEIVIRKGWSVIRGNNEYLLIDYKTPRAPIEWNDPVQFAPTAWLDRQFDQNLKTLIAAWPDTLNLRFRDAPPIQVFHGTPDSPWDSLYWTLTNEEIERLLRSTEANYIICGHTHLPMDRQSGRWHIFNPGSVGVPIDGIFSASYMILEGNEQGWKAAFRRISFDYDTIFEEFEKSGYNKESGPMGRLVIEVYKRARPLLGFLRWRSTYRPDSALTDELVDEFLSNYNWWEFAHPAYHINVK